MSENLILRRDNGFALSHDDWLVVRDTVTDLAGLPADPAIVNLASWRTLRDHVGVRQLGVWLAPDDEPADLADDFDRIALIAVDFPVFRDGRGYSTAVLLRTRLGWQGPLRAIGDVLRDQLLHMIRCGFDSLALRPDQDARAALAAFDEMSVRYQGSVLDPRPIYRRERAAVSHG